MSAILGAIIKIVVGLLPGYKTWIGALLLGVVAANKALAEVGIILIPDNIINIIGIIAAALMGVGLRHAIAKNGKALAMLFAIGIPLFIAGCSTPAKSELPVDSTKACKCVIECKCEKCDCKPGSKCCVRCDCHDCCKP